MWEYQVSLKTCQVELSVNTYDDWFTLGGVLLFILFLAYPKVVLVYIPVTMTCATIAGLAGFYGHRLVRRVIK